jgi:hypothetical protein
MHSLLRDLHPTKFVKLRLRILLRALVVLMVLAALPGAIQETLETGRIYLFSWQFIEELPRRFTGPGRLRFILQPLTAVLLGVFGGLKDAKKGEAPYLFALFFHAEKRRGLLLSGFAAIGDMVAIGILLDAAAQLLIYRQIHPGPALLIGPLLIGFPYAASRGLSGRVARWLKQKDSVRSHDG